jgi:predicted nucleic acid-binding protein
MLQSFDRYFTQTMHEMAELTRDVLERATEIRARYNFQTSDAIHLAAAIHSQCDTFLTNDRQLIRFGGIRVEVV